MALWDNIRLAFASLWAGKLRALLTMLGIIIGIGAVIAIVTVGNSLTGSITSSLSGFGINNITVSLEQKDEDSGYSVISMGRGAAMISGGGGLMFGPSAPSEEDLLTDGMIAEYKEAFGDRVAGVACTQLVGSGTVTQGETSVTVSASGVNADYTAVNDVEMLAGPVHPGYRRGPGAGGGERSVLRERVRRGRRLAAGAELHHHPERRHPAVLCGGRV